MYALGKEAENVLSSLTYEERESEDQFDAVMAKFISRRNVIHERVCFNQRVQHVGERAETFIRALYKLSTSTTTPRGTGKEHAEVGW